MPRRLLTVCSFVALASFVATACSPDQTKNREGDTGGPTCSRGLIEGPNGNCIRPDEDDTSSGDTSPTDTASTDTDDPTDTGPTPSPDGSGCSLGDCPENKFCNEGECIAGQSCEAGNVLGCGGDHKKRVCPDKGVGWKYIQCPDDKPHCRSGKCHKTICEPGSTFCKGDALTLKKCSEDGMSTSTVKTCRTRCQDGKCVSGCGATAKESYIGCGFQAVDLDNHDRARPGEQPANAKQFAVTASNTTDEKVDVDVKDSSGSSVASATINSGSAKVVDLPRADVKNTVLTDKSYTVDATGPITLHQFNPINQAGTATNDASLLLPSSAIGTDYTVVNWPSVRAPRSGTGTNAPYVTIVAAEQGETKVTVGTPVKIISGSGVQAMSAGELRTFTLNQGQVLQLRAEQEEGNDVTGMSVSADQKVAVFAGHECANVDLDSQFCDHLEQQLFPNKSLGKTYALSKFSPRGNEDDLFRIVAAEDGTTVNTVPPISGIDGTKLDAGEVKEFKFRDNLLVKADKPIAVGQFMVGSWYPGRDEQCKAPSVRDPEGETRGCKVQTMCDDGTTRIGDPAFMLNVSTSQFLEEYVIRIPKSYQEDWINIVAPEGASVQVDGSALSGSGQAISGTKWRIYQKRVSPGVHRIKSTGGKKFGLYGYGYGCDVSYAYPGGLDLGNSSGP